MLTLILALGLAHAELPAETPATDAALATEAAPTDAAPTDAAPTVALPVGPTAWPELPTEPDALDAAVREKLAADGIEADKLDDIATRWKARVAFDRKLRPQVGQVTLGDGLATVDLGDRFYFLDGADAVDVIEAWGNPRPRQAPLGLIVPAHDSPMADIWAVVVDFSEEGHIDDSDAASIDYDELLTQMQADTEEGNAARVEAGYGALRLAGWAEPPHYDAADKKLYWAKHLASDGGDSLNYDIRVLGRRGVLEMSAVSGLSELDAVRTGMQDLLPRVAFDEGHRYVDFDPNIDKVAAFGIGALIAGKVAAKAGLFKGFIALLLAGKKLILPAILVGVGAVKAFFGGKKSESSEG